MRQHCMVYLHDWPFIINFISQRPIKKLNYDISPRKQILMLDQENKFYI